jgi:hypothetical protein
MLTVMLLLAQLTWASGCLNIGGKSYTTTSTDWSQANDRLSALEGRVGALEQTVYGQQPPPLAAPRESVQVPAPSP